MKILSRNFIRLWRRALRGFTMVEMLVAVTVFSLVILATIAVQIYASRIYGLTATTLNATEQARVTMNSIRDKVREARVVYVGNYRPASGGTPLAHFSTVTNGFPQQGNALAIFPTSTDTNTFSLVYLQAPGSGFTAMSVNSVAVSSNALILLTYTNGTMAVSNDVADFITNQVVFDAENFMGTILTNNQNNYLIRMKLNFSQYAAPIASVGNNHYNAYDYYQLNTVVTRRDSD
ncbi:MAG TPA: prepilin-type N-terminal cleavage/methylation domain-containing protein [Pseudomonadales bacterium]|nr:prepilin-type N-terminal cleavage/methylation domain-containing protein [Pseudomonadales bacterium]